MKNENLFSKKKAKRIKKAKKAKRIKKEPKSPFNIIIRDWGQEFTEHQKMKLNEDSKLEISIDDSTYTVSINKKNRCLEFATHDEHLYIQPISVHQLLIKTGLKSKVKQNESNKTKQD